MAALTKALAVEPLARPGTRLVKPSLKQCQLDTPDTIVKFVWERVGARRDRVATVLDLGAGDGRFSNHGEFDRYVGYEIDPKRVPRFVTTRYGVQHADALDVVGAFDIAVGNPPYIRHQDLRDSWRARAARLIEDETKTEADLRANLYVYFMWLGLLRTTDVGLVAQVVPADWLVRPSARKLREYIAAKKWGVDVYVFDDAKTLFPAVKTNLTVTVIDKGVSSGAWNYFGVTSDLKIVGADARAGFAEALAPFPTRRRRQTETRATRGLSPGGQAVFVLTEAQRRSTKIARSSVVPCVTSLRGLPASLTKLTAVEFDRHFVRGGRRCWLLRTNLPRVSQAVLDWLDEAPASIRENWTCSDRDVWYRFDPPRVCDILYSSGFRTTAPLFLVNAVGAISVGAVHGILDVKDPSGLAGKLRRVDYSRSRFKHGRHLMKIEISQMNELLGNLLPS